MSDNSTADFGLLGHVIDAPAPDEVRSWPDGAVIVREGKITAVGDAEELRKDPQFYSVEWRNFPEETMPVILPGLIDIHAHIPHYSYFEEVDITELEALRKHLNDRRSSDEPKLTYLPFIMLAVARAFAKYPAANAH